MSIDLQPTNSLETMTVPGVNDLTKQLTSDALTTWSDARRQEFVQTFNGRVKAAQYILVKTAQIVLELALKKHFLSEKHIHSDRFNWDNHFLPCYDDRSNYHYYHTVGGRTQVDLDAIAKERADEVVHQLPSMSSAVRILNPEAAGWIERRDRLVAKGNELLDISKEVAGPLDLEDLPETTTLKEIRRMGEEREAKRVNIKNKLDQIGEEGSALESKINKFLYDGLPGLSDAVLNLISTYIDKSIAFDAMQRRVGEQVMFGDSAAAIELLRGFENDEQTISEEVKVQFDEALQKLKLIAAKNRKNVPAKQLKSGHGK